MTHALEAKPTQVRLRPDQRVKLEAIVKKEDRDVSWVIRKALDDYIERYDKKKK
jgi:predicted transcriptional regulator